MEYLGGVSQVEYLRCSIPGGLSQVECPRWSVPGGESQVEYLRLSIPGGVSQVEYLRWSLLVGCASGAGLCLWHLLLMICEGTRGEGVDPVYDGTGTENCVTRDIWSLANYWLLSVTNRHT